MVSRLAWTALGALLLAGCGVSRPTPESRTPGPGYYARHALVIGRLPNGQGFGIWMQRFRFEGKGKDRVQLIASLAPPSASIAKIRNELEAGVNGSTEDLVEELREPVALRGLEGCGKRPVVLLYGLIHGRVGAAVLISAGRVQPFARVSIPPELGVNGVLGYGFLASPAILQIKSPTGETVYSQDYPGPKRSGGCAAGGTASLVYLFPKT